MEWFPIVFGVLKLTALATAAYFAIKWHHDQAKKDKAEKEAREQELQQAQQAARAQRASEQTSP
ncbi:MAG: hypothetical protein Q4E06_08350 [Lautropia sp.]|nr:hypothetical protein [Lautropia sp.]